MREALARSDLDFVVYDDERRGFDRSRLPRILRVSAAATAVLVCAVILGNAMFLQDSKHPAPLMRVPDPQPAPVAAPPLPAPRVVPTAAPGPAAPVAPAKSSAKNDASGDEIARLITATDRKPRADAPREARSDAIANLLGAPEASASVLAAQKALVKLGYVLRADGLAGATTRQAVEQYERDNHLPVRGELTPKLMRELAAKSGIPAQ